jgi:hypothetical protein
LSAAYPSGRFVSQRFRPNVTLDCGDAVGFLETDWIGRSLAVGPLADEGHRALPALRPHHAARKATCPRTQASSTPRKQHNQNRVGIYTEIGAAGVLRIGDAAILQ